MLFMRHPEKLDAGLADVVEVAVGDQLDPDDVLRATRGAEALFWVNPLSPRVMTDASAR